MNVKVNGHNFLAITLMAAVGLLLIKMAGKTQLGALPGVGAVLGWLGKA